MRTLILALMLLASTTQAEPQRMTAAEIEPLLTGNTAVGEWRGRWYRQLFRADGSTIYAEKGRRSALGEWRVNSETDDFESLWPGGAWEPFGVARIDGGLFWLEVGREPAHFEMIEGEALVWAED
ncbi:MAG: hypothetical protein AAF401_04650 [Pseudomonadota bacterium]